MSNWSPYAEVYVPVKAGSIDSTDTIPHDKGIERASSVKYVLPESEMSKSKTLFIGSLAPKITEDDIMGKFSYIGKIKSIKLIRDIVTGKSKGYAFVEYKHSKDASDAYHELKETEFNGKKCILDYECSRSLKGWIPRRLGGGWGGKKESGQLRFGCRMRPFKKPIILNN